MNRTFASSLQFPEGPVIMPDGSLLVVEIKRKTLTRIHPNGRTKVIAHLGGGPNGAAIGPDGACYICNNGGFGWLTHGSLTIPHGVPDIYQGGSIQRVDLSTGNVETLYDRADGYRLRGPNDLVFDSEGGFWFTDLGKARTHDIDRGSIYYAKADGTMIREMVTDMLTRNGIGLSPDGRTLYAAETETARILSWSLDGPGQIATGAGPGPGGGRLVYASPTFVRFGSLAVDAEGNISVATIHDGGITTVTPSGEWVDFFAIPEDPIVTNICFGGPELRTAWITCSGTGVVLQVDWPRAGLPLASQQ